MDDNTNDTGTATVETAPSDAEQPVQSGQPVMPEPVGALNENERQAAEAAAQPVRGEMVDRISGYVWNDKDFAEGLGKAAATALKTWHETGVRTGNQQELEFWDGKFPGSVNLANAVHDSGLASDIRLEVTHYLYSNHALRSMPDTIRYLTLKEAFGKAGIKATPRTIMQLSESVGKLPKGRR